MPDGIDKESPSYNHMQQTSTSKVLLAAENKAAGISKRSVNKMGQDQTNSMESESIYLLLQFIPYIMYSLLLVMRDQFRI